MNRRWLGRCDGHLRIRALRFLYCVCITVALTFFGLGIDERTLFGRGRRRLGGLDYSFFSGGLRESPGKGQGDRTDDAQ